MAAKLCRKCGADVGHDEHVELRVLDWKAERVHGLAACHWRRSSESIASLIFCPACAAEVMDRVYEGV